MAWAAKVNRHVQLLKVSGGTIKIKPGVIIGFANPPNNDPIIRVGRKGETYGDNTTGVPRRTDVDENLIVTKYISY